MPWEKQFGVVEVLDSAMQAFWVHGYEATSVQDLVERTGVNRASLYATYGDKHDLFLAALRHYRETRLHLFVTELELRYSPVDAVRRLFQAFVDQVAVQGLNQGCFLANTALELAAHDPEAAAIVADAQKDPQGQPVGGQSGSHGAVSVGHPHRLGGAVAQSPRSCAVANHRRSSAQPHGVIFFT